VILQRRREQLAVLDPEEGPGGPFQDRPLRRHEEPLVEAALLGQAAGEHVDGVGQRLDPVEQQRGLVGDGGHASSRGLGRERLHGHDAPAAAREHHADLAVHGTGCLQQRVGLGLQRVEVSREPEVLGASAHADDVLVVGEGDSLVEP
jgi:hypothetical protein